MFDSALSFSCNLSAGYCVYTLNIQCSQPECRVRIEICRLDTMAASI